MRALFRLLFIASCGLASSLAVAATSTAVEFYHGAYGHYFVTVSPQEIAGLDSGVLPGWSRTGESFGVFDLDTAGAANVCRFWTAQRFAPKSSHFYTPVASECATVKGNPDWQFEGEVFALMLPDAAGNCAAGAAPLYRLYNDGKTGAPNHRYTTREAIRTEMLAQGWKAEGSGIGVIGCVPEPATPLTIVAAGDIGQCFSAPAAASAAARTAALVSPLDALVLTLGDHAYDSGRPAEFANCFDPTWGAFKDRIRPTPGNHDYYTPGAKGTSAISARRRALIGAATTASTTGAGISSRSTASSTSPPGRRSTSGCSRISRNPAAACARSRIGTIPRSTRGRPTAATGR